MTNQSDLPPDQNAVLSLLLRQHKSYEQVAGMLAIEESAVRDRAYAAISTLGAGEGTSLLHTHRQEIGDYLLGQRQSLSQSTVTYLQTLANARTWALELRDKLGALSSQALPALPEPEHEKPAPPPEPPPIQVTENTPAVAPAQSAPGPTPPSSRRGGALLLLAIVAIVTVAIVLIVDGSGGSKSPIQSTSANTTSSSKATTTSSSTNSGSSVHLINQLNLNSPDPSSQAKGVVDLVSQGGSRAFYLVAEHLPSTIGFFYVAWLYDSENHATPLGKAPNVSANGRLQAAGPLPSKASKFRRLVLTKETSEHATHPGQIILSGPFSLH